MEVRYFTAPLASLQKLYGSQETDPEIRGIEARLDQYKASTIAGDFKNQ